MRIDMLPIVTLALLGMASASRHLSQLACGPTPNSTSVPQNALLYLSLRANGTIDYVCNAYNQSTNGFKEQATLSNDGYTGRIFLNTVYHSHGLNNVLQIDVGILSNTTQQYVNNTLVLNPNPITQASPDAFAIPYARWTVNSTAGAPTPAGLPPIAFVTRIDTIGGVPHKCPALSTGTTPYQAVYNLYTCDPAYLGPVSPPTGSSPANTPSASPSSPVVGFNPLSPVLPAAPTPSSPSPSPSPSPLLSLSPSPSPVSSPASTTTSPAPIPAPITASPPSPKSGSSIAMPGLLGIVSTMLAVALAMDG